ncbi:MAG: DHH family phosphoesterase [candidate division WOR-3 bacterium]
MWAVKQVDCEERVAELARRLDLPEEIVRTLYLRGHKTVETIKGFLEARLSELYPFETLPDIKLAVERIKQSIDLQTPILIWGHEDLDGITSVIILTETIKELGGIVYNYIPTKGKEPHGINIPKALEYHVAGVKLIITVDCGITNHNEIKELRAQSVDVIVTDHHEVLDNLPPAIANVNPKRIDSKYPFDQLAACGIAFKLAWALYSNFYGWTIEDFVTKKPEFLIWTMLGTIADRVPLINENRILAKHGLELITENSRPIIKAIVKKLNSNNAVTTDKIINEIVPLFASANGNEACRYFQSQNEEEILSWLDKLQAESQAWRALAKENLQLAEKIAEISEGIIIIYNENLSLKTLGHIAGKFKDQYQLPVIVLGKKTTDWVAECRGINGIDLIEMLKAHSDLLITYGGHKKACGFTIANDKLTTFIAKIKEYAKANFVGKIIQENIVLADAFLPIRSLPLEVIKKLPPFGEGNPSPIFISKDTAVSVINNNLYFIERPDLSAVISGDKITSKIFEFYPERVFADILYTTTERGEIVILSVDYPQ